jgi:hypothetical protein
VVIIGSPVALPALSPSLVVSSLVVLSSPELAVSVGRALL